MSRHTVSRNMSRLNAATIYFIFGFCLIILSLFDSDRRLYGSVADNGVGLSSSFVGEEMGVVYVVRNAIIYIPVITYYYINKGVLSLKFIELFFLIFMCLSPLGVFSFTEISFGDTPLTLENLFLYGQSYIPFNTYVPFLGMITTMSLYFIFSNKNFAYKLISIILYLFIVLYTFASSSRQSIIFILLSSLIFILFNLKYRSICYLIVFCIILLWGSGYVVDNFNINREVAEKFLGGDINTFFESNRMNKIQEGFDLLYLHEIFVGAGIGSVPFSGPHNDFVRWIQRSGIFVGLLGFLPFF